MMTFLQAAEAVATSEETRMGLWKLFSMGGWLMWPLLALGGVTIFIFVERFMAIRKASVLDMNFMNRIRDYISDGKISTAVNLCKKTDTPIARMIEKGIERIGRPMSDVQTAIENVANLEVSKLENGLPFLATIAGGAPMIGFLGTVLGMVQTFMDMAAAGGTVDLSLLASGMYVAMVTTVGGLIVGIPAYFGYNYLVARIEKLVFQMEANSIAFMDILNQPVQHGSKVDKSFSASSMTDLMFLLLLFLLIATTLINPNALKLMLPKSSNMLKDKAVTTVSIQDTGHGKYRYYVELQDVGSVEGVERALKSRLDGQKEPTVSLHADKTVAWDEIIKVMNVAKNNGYKLIAATSPE